MKKILPVLLAVLPFFLGAQTDTSRLKEYSERISKSQKLEMAQDLQKAASLQLPLLLEQNGRSIEFAGFFNGFPRYRITSNLIAAHTTSTSPLWNGGSAGLNLSGNGVILGIWDGGPVRTTHQEYAGRVTVTDGTSNTSNHATHVAGTMIASGIDALAKGMSPQATLFSNNWDNDNGEMANMVLNGMSISNHSYGFISGWYFNYRGDSKWVWFGDTTLSTTEDYGFGAYTWDSEQWDNIAFLAQNYLIVKSAGNDRGEGPATQPVSHWLWNGGDWVLSSSIRSRDGGILGYDCIPWHGVAKNILTVGAVGDIPGGYQQPSDVVHAGFSGSGPADDGRIKPDIVANGTGLYSSVSSSDTGYGNSTGTSMSSPNASGSAGLLVEHWRNLTGNANPAAATLKGLIIHTASEAGSNPGPDYKFGWGLLNTTKAALLISDNASEGFDFNIRQTAIANNQTITIPVYTNGTEPLLATICWTDPPSPVYGQTANDRTPMLINDLDLRLINSAGDIYFPWKLDPDNPANAAIQADNIVDNVEKVEAGLPEPQETWFVQVSHKGTLLDELPQNFSLIISGIMPAPAATTWLGETSNEWNTITNWNDGKPSVSTNVVVPGSALNMPTLSSNAYANNVTLNDGASMLGNNYLNISGDALIEREISNELYHYVSSPVAAASAGSVFPLSTFLRFYDETHPSAQWVNIYQNDIMQPAKGYAAFIPGIAGSETTATFPGLLNDGPFNINGLTFTSNSSPNYDGYNLVGNPYPSPIDLESSSLLRTNLDATAYFWDPSLNAEAGGYATWTIGATGTNGGSRYIPVAQGFFVKVSGEGQNGGLNLNNDVRTHSTRPFYKNEPTDLLRILVTGENLSDETVIRFAEGATPAFDGEFDAWKLQNYGVNQLYTRGQDDIQLALNAFRDADQFPVVPVNYRVSSSGEFDLEVSGIQTFAENLPVVLLDLKMNYRQDLRINNKYRFFSDQGDDENRFAITFGTLSVPESDFADFTVYYDGSAIQVNFSNPTNAMLEVIDINGKVLKVAEIKGSNSYSIPAAFKAGVYIVRVKMGDFVSTKKLVLK